MICPETGLDLKICWLWLLFCPPLQQEAGRRGSHLVGGGKRSYHAQDEMERRKCHRKERVEGESNCCVQEAVERRRGRQL